MLCVLLPDFGARGFCTPAPPAGTTDGERLAHPGPRAVARLRAGARARGRAARSVSKNSGKNIVTLGGGSLVHGVRASARAGKIFF